MTLYIGDKLIAGKPDGVLNNPFSLLDSKYSDHKLNNLSWLRSNGQMNSGTVYVDAYNLLLKLYNGTETIEGITVKALGDSTITDYDFVIDTANTQFKLPLKSHLASGKAVVGNGMTLGLTNGTNFSGLYSSTQGATGLLDDGNSYGKTIGNTSSSGRLIIGSSVGVSQDPTKSGIETDTTGLYLYFYVGETVQNANLIDAGRIEETLATKEDIDTWVYYQNGTSGYRYNRRNGYCEQWGITNATTAGTTINLVKTFADTNYNGFAQNAVNTYRSDSYASEISVIPNTGSNFKLYSGVGAGVNSRWKVWGYLAQGEF